MAELCTCALCVECRLSCTQPVGDNQCSEFGISVQDHVRRMFLLVNLSQDARYVPGCVVPERNPQPPGFSVCTGQLCP